MLNLLKWLSALFGKKKAVPLERGEIETLITFSTDYRAGMLQAQTAARNEAQYLALLRQKYGLDERWVCHDPLDGFVVDGEVTHAENN